MFKFFIATLTPIDILGLPVHEKAAKTSSQLSHAAPKLTDDVVIPEPPVAGRCAMMTTPVALQNKMLCQ